jgi:uncharacterized protein (DUF2164 family)
LNDSIAAEEEKLKNIEAELKKTKKPLSFM